MPPLAGQLEVAFSCRQSGACLLSLHPTRISSLLPNSPPSASSQCKLSAWRVLDSLFAPPRAHSPLRRPPSTLRPPRRVRPRRPSSRSQTSRRCGSVSPRTSRLSYTSSSRSSRRRTGRRFPSTKRRPVRALPASPLRRAIFADGRRVRVLAAYYVAFGPHGPRAPIDPPGTTPKVVIGVTALIASAGIIFYAIRATGTSLSLPPACVSSA